MATTPPKEKYRGVTGIANSRTVPKITRKHLQLPLASNWSNSALQEPIPLFLRAISSKGDSRPRVIWVNQDRNKWRVEAWERCSSYWFSSPLNLNMSAFCLATSPFGYPASLPNRPPLQLSQCLLPSFLTEGVRGSDFEMAAEWVAGRGTQIREG